MKLGGESIIWGRNKEGELVELDPSEVAMGKKETLTEIFGELAGCRLYQGSSLSKPGYDVKEEEIGIEEGNKMRREGNKEVKKAKIRKAAKYLKKPTADRYQCANPDCDIWFKQKRRNDIYCCNKCKQHAAYLRRKAKEGAK